MWITKTSINHPVFATMVMVALMVMGVISYNKLGVEQLPDITPPVVFVSVQHPGASPESIENDITKPIEEAVNTISGIKMIRSTTWEGRSDTAIIFEIDVNMDRVTQEVRDKIAQIRPNFPKEAKDPFIVRGDTENAQPVVTIGVQAKEHNLRDLSTMTEQIIVKRLQGVPGVGEVKIGGSVRRQIIVNVDPAQVNAQGVGVDEVVNAIKRSNQDMPAGSLIRGESEKLVRIEGKMQTPREFEKIIVARRGASGGAPVTIEQVAQVVDGEKEATSISRVNGKPAIVLQVIKVQDANIVKVGDGVKEALEELKKRLPADVELQVVNATSDWVRTSLSRVKSTIVEGAALTVLIVFLFLHSWRSTIITGLTLPISVIASFIALHACGFTLNFMTLMALSLSIGLLIDDAIVVRENIVRHLGMGKGHRTAARDGTEEIGLAVMATTFAIVAVFVPVAFMDGIIGRFFMQFGITVTVAVLVSLFVSFTLDPMLSSVWRDPAHGRFGRLPWLGSIMQRIENAIEWLHVIYGRILGRALHWRKTTLAAALALFVGSFFLVPMIGTEFVPEVDQGFTTLKFKVPIGSSLDYTDAKMQQVEAALKEFKEIRLISTTVGTDEGRNTAQLDIKLTDVRTTHRRPQKAVEEAIRKRVEKIPGITLSVGLDKPIYVAILGPEADKLKEVVDRVMAQMAKIKGIADLESSLDDASPTIIVRVDNEKASDLGLSLQQVGDALRPFLAGDTISYYLGPDGQNYDVIVQLPKDGRQKVADLADLQLASSRIGANGRPLMVPLRQVVQFVPSTSPRTIKRQDLQRRVGIYANVQGRPAGDVGSDVQKLVQTIELPAGYRFDIGGQTKDMQDSFVAAVTALGLAVIFIYLILASQFGSFLQPLAIMASLPLSLVGVFGALLLTHSTLNIFSIIGFIMLMGLVTKNAILLVDFANKAQRDGLSQYEALMQAGQVRLRPIIMTTLAMIFGMLPMALGLGEGAEQQAPMGRAVIGGIITSTLLTLVVVPVAYTWLDAWGRKVAARFGSGDDEESESVAVGEKQVA